MNSQRLRPHSSGLIGLFLSFLLTSLIVATGCGTFEVGIEPGGVSAVQDGIDMTPIDEGHQTPSIPAPSTSEGSLSEPPLATSPNPLVIALNWTGEMKGTCQSLMINYGGEAAIGQCKQSFREMIPLDDRFDYADLWPYWLERFAPFESRSQMALVTMQGLGDEEASPAWQRAIARWAELVWVEIETEGRSESWTTALSWREEMADRPGYCASLQVSLYGMAQASFAPCDSQTPEVQVEDWLETAEWEQFDAWYYSRAPLSDADLDFFGTGLLEMKASDIEALHRWAEAAFNRLIFWELMESL